MTHRAEFFHSDIPQYTFPTPVTIPNRTLQQLLYVIIV